MMKRLMLLTAILFAMALVWTSSIQAQTPFPGGNSTIITLSNRQAKFFVDGLHYQGSASFLWPAGSKHIIRFANVNEDGFQYNDQRNTRFFFGSWRTDSSTHCGE